jgi:hypothetical protein
VAVSFVGGGKQRIRRKPPTCRKSLANFIKEKVQKDKHRSTKHAHKTKDRATRTPLKTGGELRFTVPKYLFHKRPRIRFVWRNCILVLFTFMTYISTFNKSCTAGSPVFSWVRVVQSLVSVCYFVDHCFVFLHF